MDKELRDKWVAALRSGDYQQGYDFLRVGDRFCCLGVLGDLLGVLEPSRTGAWHCDRNFCMLPTSVAQPNGLNTNTQNRLIALNDNLENFNSIANWIEENIPITDD